MIISPCISICKTDPSTGYCYGCGRNNEEKKTWKLEDTTDDWKLDNLEELKKGLMAGNWIALTSLMNIKLIMECLFSKRVRSKSK